MPRIASQRAAALIAGIGCISVFLVLFAPRALADTVEKSGFVAGGSTTCAWDKSGLSHGTPGGYSRSTASRYVTWKQPCDNQNKSEPYHIATTIILAKWVYTDDGGGYWAACSFIGTSDDHWYYNSNSGYYAVVSVRWQGQDSSGNWSTDNPKCGPGYYATFGGTGAYDDFDEQWNGGYLYSGYHYLPTYGGN